MIKPILNLDEVTFDDIEDNGYFTSKRGQISDHIGAKKLGYDHTAARQITLPIPQSPRRRRNVSDLGR